MKLKFGKLSLILALFVGLALVSCAPVVEPGNGNGTDPVPDPPVDLSAMTASTATAVELFNAENTYVFPFYVAGIIRAEPGGSALTNDGIPMSPLGSDENVKLDVLLSGAAVNAGLVVWGGADETAEFKFQGAGTPTEAWSYDATDGIYKFVVNKKRFKFGVDSLVFCSTTKPAAWSSVGAGIGENALPEQTTMGIGAMVFDVVVTGLDLSKTAASAITWVATNAANDSITMIGVKNGDATFEIYLKGSVVSSNVIADLSGATAFDEIWGQFLVILGKGTPPTATPVFDPVDGSTFSPNLTPTVSTTTPGSVILWTSDAWTTTNELVATPIPTITADTTFAAFATNTDRADSAIATASYSLACETPTVDPTSQFIPSDAALTVTLTSAGNDIIWTTNGWVLTGVVASGGTVDVNGAVDSTNVLIVRATNVAIPDSAVDVTNTYIKLADYVSLGATALGGASSWARSFNIYEYSAASVLYLYFERTGEGFDSGHNFMIHLDNNVVATGSTIDTDFGWGNAHTATSGAIGNIDLTIFDNYKSDATFAAAQTWSGGTGTAYAAHTVTVDAGGDIEIAIPYAGLGAVATDTVDLYLLYVGGGELHDSFPAPVSATASADQTVAITLN